jgi:hypothetical protein
MPIMPKGLLSHHPDRATRNSRTDEHRQLAHAALHKIAQFVCLTTHKFVSSGGERPVILSLNQMVCLRGVYAAGHTPDLLQCNINCFFCDAEFLRPENSVVRTAHRMA